jgi:hypothetical protein
VFQHCPQNGVLRMHPSGSWKDWVGGCQIGNIGVIWENSPYHCCRCLLCARLMCILALSWSSFCLAEPFNSIVLTLVFAHIAVNWLWQLFTNIPLMKSRVIKNFTVEEVQDSFTVLEDTNHVFSPLYSLQTWFSTLRLHLLGPLKDAF